MKRLTVAIPNYNGGKNLERAILSCKHIRLSPNDFEILVADNESTDNSISIVNELKTQFSNIELYSNGANLGRIRNWNICIDKAHGKYITFLSTNDIINKNNNIHQILEFLDSDESLSLSISALIKRENGHERIKKNYFKKPIKCLSEKLAKTSFVRGIFPFGFIEASIYRLDDIKKTKNYFLEDFPFNADEIFSYIQLINRKYVLFNECPQITWILSKDRFYSKTKIEDELIEYYKTVEILKKELNFEVDYGLVASYRLVNLLKYLIRHSNKDENRRRLFSFIFSEMRKKHSFFKIDSIFIKTLFAKLANPREDTEDILFKNILKNCVLSDV